MSAPLQYRLTRPDGLGFLRGRSMAQFLIGAAGIGLGALALVVRAAGTPRRGALAIAGVALLVLGTGRTPTGEDLLDLLAPAARFAARRLTGRHHHVALLAPFSGAPLPPLFSGITLADIRLGELGNARRCGIVLDRADGSVSLVLRVHGEGFLLFDGAEQDARLGCFAAALAGVGKDESVLVRAAWSQFVAPSPLAAHLDYLDAAARSDANEEVRVSYMELVNRTAVAASAPEVHVVLSASLGRVRAPAGSDRLAAAVNRLVDEATLFTSELARGGLTASVPLPAGVIARLVRERLDPSVRERLSRRGRSLADTLGLVTPENGFPLVLEEQRRMVRCDERVHRLFRVAEWPRSAVRADWLAAFLCEREVTRTFTVSFVPQPRQLARRQALAVATRVGAGIEERESKGRRVGAEERRAQLAAEALDEELEAGAQMELVVGLIDVSAADEESLNLACEHTLQSAADCGMELRVVELRQGEALVATLPLGRTVLGRAR